MAKKIVDPNDTGSVVTDDDKNGGTVTLDMVKELLADFGTGIRTELNKAVTGAVHRNVAETLKAPEFVDGLKGMFSGLIDEKVKPAKPEKEPSDVEALKSQIGTLSKVIETESSLRKQAEQKAAAQSLDNGILNAINGLDGKDGRPNLRKDARDAVYNLVRTGYNLPGKPELGDNGAVIIRQPDGEAKPLSAVLGNGYFGQDHWAIDKFTASGSGARSSSQTPPAFDWKNYGTAKSDEELAKQYANDPDGLVAALQQRGTQTPGA